MWEGWPNVIIDYHKLFSLEILQLGFDKNSNRCTISILTNHQIRELLALYKPSLSFCLLIGWGSCQSPWIHVDFFHVWAAVYTYRRSKLICFEWIILLILIVLYFCNLVVILIYGSNHHTVEVGNLCAICSPCSRRRVLLLFSRHLPHSLSSSLIFFLI